MQRQQLEALLVQVVLFLVDLPVAGDDLAGQVDVPLLQGADRLEHRGLRQPGQADEVALQFVEVALQVFGHQFTVSQNPNRTVP